MNLRSRLCEGWRSRAIAGGLVAFVGVLCWILIFTQGLDRLSYDLPFALRPGFEPDGVLVVYMDEDSRKALNQQVNGRWDRTLHAKLIEELFAQHARAVVFDIL